MKSLISVALVAFVFGIAACSAETEAPSDPTTPAAAPSAPAEGVKEIGTFPAGSEANAELGVDHWTVYHTAGDVMIVIGQDRANQTIHTSTTAFAKDAQGVSYVKSMTSNAKAKNLSFTLHLDSAGTVLSTDGDPNAGFGTSLLSKDIDAARLHQEQYSWWGCIGWSLAAIGTCGLAGGACWTAGVFTGGASCYYGGTACVGGVIGAVDSCVDAANQR